MKLRGLQEQRDESDDGLPGGPDRRASPPFGKGDPRSRDGHYYISLGRRPGAPKWVPGWCWWEWGGVGCYFC